MRLQYRATIQDFKNAQNYGIYFGQKIPNNGSLVFDRGDKSTFAKAIQEIIDQSAEQRFLFDLEIFSLLSKKGYFFVPIPVALDYQYSSTIGVSATYSMIVGTVRLAWRTKNQASWSRKRKALNLTDV